MKYYLGIDSGGTKTEFALADEQGHLVGRSRMGTTHYQQVGIQGLTENLTGGLEELLRTSGVDHQDIHRAFIGLAAYDEIQADMVRMNQAVGRSLRGIKFEIGGDNLCAWAGSLGGHGICCISSIT